MIFKGKQRNVPKNLFKKRKENTEYDAEAAGADPPCIGLAPGCTYCIAGIGCDEVGAPDWW